MKKTIILFSLILFGNALLAQTPEWQWAEQAGGIDSDLGYRLALDSAGNSYVTGCFMGTATFGSNFLTSSGEEDIFVAKLGNNTSVEIELIPIKMELSNYPNPFNPTTTIRFDIKENERGRLTIFNLKGQMIVSEVFEAGQHSYQWDAGNCGTGLYLYRLKTDSDIITKKMLMMK